MLQEFKRFAMRGNVIDLAVGFILGGAFSSIVTSLVNDIIMPPIGLVLGVPKNTVLSRLARAREALRRKLSYLVDEK